MTRRIFRSIFAVAAAVLAASLVILLAFLYDYFAGVQEQELRDQLSLAAAGVEDSGADYLRSVTAERSRLTWIGADGAVLCDTVTDAETLENHAGREEIREALETGEGRSIRYSDTLLEKTIYCARRLPDGTVLRISVSRETAGTLAFGTLQPLLIVLVLALVLSALLAGRLSRRIVEPLNTLDLEHPLENDTYPELAPLLRRLEHQRESIDAHMQELRRRSDEFDQITASMREGLVLLDEQGRVLSINPAARRLFGAEDDDCIGRDFLTVERAPDVSEALRTAAAEGHGEARLSRGGRAYRLDVSRIESGGERIGSVLLSFDVTEREAAERMRREFTANVSHELKTPLQGIIGSAELLENGMVQPEDQARFVGHIRTEAQRLVALVGDIIRLSQLDEGVPMPHERVELLSLAQDVVRDLAPAAAERQVSLSAAGEPAAVNGVRSLLYEVLYNLCDNAVKYNVPGGTARIEIAAEGKTAVLRVSDTGVGVAPEDTERIFERFYRVDKSRSKAGGGTGLGLSIVKHAVAYHGGTIELQSTPGKGTVITVKLPLEA